MKFDWRKPVLGPGGDPIQLPDGQHMRTLTYGDACSNALLDLIVSQDQRRGEIHPEEKAKLFDMWLAINSKPDYDFSASEIALIEHRVKAYQTVFMVGRILQFLKEPMPIEKAES